MSECKDLILTVHQARNKWPVQEVLLYIDEQFNSLPVHCDFSYFAVKCIYNTMQKRALYDKKLANARALFTVLFRLW